MSGTATNTKGDINDGQAIVPLPPVSSIHKINRENGGGDLGKYFELASKAGLDLIGLTLISKRGSQAPSVRLLLGVPSTARAPVTAPSTSLTGERNHEWLTRWGGAGRADCTAPKI
jgi:hypothetical protein